MKKIWKRLIAVAVATLMLISMLPMAVMAESKTEGTVEIIKNGEDKNEFLAGAQFSFYQLASINNEGDKWTYTVNEAYTSVLGGHTMKNLDELVAAEWENQITNLDAIAASQTATNTSNETGSDGSTGKTTLSLGIYLVKETKVPEGYMASAAFIVSVPSTNNYSDKKGETIGEYLEYDIVAQPKNEKLSIEKTILDNTTNVGIGDTVKYKIESMIPKYGDAYTNPKFNIYDTMSEGLTLDEAIKVTVNGTEVGLSEDAYSIEIPGTGNTGKTFEIIFKPDYIKANGGNKVIVEYSATVNENAEYTIGNKAGITYNNAPGSDKNAETDEKKVYTYTIDLTKIGEGNDKDGLNGAIFSLTNAENEELQVVINGGDKATIVNADTELETATVEMDKGKLVIKGLAAGTYTLTEVKSPAGYTLLKNPITIVLEADTDGTLKNATVDGETVTFSEGSVAVTVNNHKGFTLPETGGMGTYIFTIGGVILMAGAIILLLTMKKKKDA